MTITKAIREFSALKESILADGVVSYEETQQLLDFVEPYANANNQLFNVFKATLMKARADGKITSEESDKITKEINTLLAFLKVERVVEYVFAGVVSAIVLFGVLQLVFK